ncbi:GNAT family N-acetyltransferase [Halobacteriales archaeon Cl-PHB]
MPIRELETEREREAALPILRQLWMDAEPTEMRDWIGRTDYHLFGRFDDQALVGVAGVLVAGHLHHERHAWLYDLVVDEPRRREGHGRTLVEYVESWAVDTDCESISLASPLAKQGVHDFYEGLGFDPWGVVLEKQF